jgi:hypothetical protein
MLSEALGLAEFLTYGHHIILTVLSASIEPAPFIKCVGIITMTTLPASGVITLGDVNVALGLSRATQISLGQASVRTLFGVTTGAISLSNGFGKSSGYNLTISANTLKYNLRTALIAAGYSGTGTFKATITINSGVYVWSDTTATAAFDTGVLSGGTITIINNGYIIGI